MIVPVQWSDGVVKAKDPPTGNTRKGRKRRKKGRRKKKEDPQKRVHTQKRSVWVQGNGGGRGGGGGGWKAEAGQLIEEWRKEDDK